MSRFLSWPVLAGVIGTVLVLAFPLLAGNPQYWIASPPQAGDAAVYDLELTLRARKVLEPLAAPNIAVSVHDRVVTLWGCAPTREVARRAEERVRQVVGVTGVINELHLKSGETEPPLLAACAPPVRSPLAEPVVVEKPRRQEVLVWRPAVPDLGPVFLVNSPPAAMTGREKSRQPGMPNEIGWGSRSNPPLTRTQAPPAEEKAPPPPSVDPKERRASLTQEVEALRLGDERYHGLRTEVADGTVRLRGTVYRMEHAFELARGVARLQGVKRVLLDGVKPEYRP